MKNVMNIILLCIVFMLCIATNVYANGNEFSLDSLTVKRDRDSLTIKYMTKSYIAGKKLYDAKIPKIMPENYEYYIAFTAESLLKIEQDGGLLKILERCLSKENYDKLSGRTRFLIGTVMNQDGYMYGNAFSLYNKNLKNITFSENEVHQIFNYIKDLRFEYQGKIEGDYMLSFFLGFNLRK